MSQQQPPPRTPDEFAMRRTDWRQRMAALGDGTARRLEEAYRRTLPALERAAGEFLVQLPLDGQLTAEELRGLTAYQRLLIRVEGEMNDFARVLRDEVNASQPVATAEGVAAARGMAISSVGRAGEVIAGVWLNPDPGAVQALVGFVDGTAMREKFAAFGENAARNLADLLLTGFAQGRNPNEIAALMAAWYNVPLAWAQNTARTAVLWSYRMGSHASYRANSDVVNGWMWTATLDSRTCISCIAQHGTNYTVDNVLNDHHRGRCVPVPLVRGARWMDDIQTGEEWFNTLSPAEQADILGPSLYEAWGRGQVGFKDFSRTYRDDVYGEMLRAATLKEMGVARVRRN